MEGAAVSLPEDIIFDVLSRLPVKPLCRFRCVSKEWRALISGEAFVAAQKSRAAPLLVGLFRSRCTDVEKKFELRVMDMDGSVLRVFRDVTKFLLPTRLDLICSYDRMRRGAMIIDPAAGQVSMVGNHNPNTYMRFWHYSFGRAAPSGAYKLLHIYESFKTHGQLCEIATIGDSGAEPTWRQRPAPPFVTDWYSGHKATVIGTLYFMAHTSSGRRENWNRIAAFDLESEEWTETINGPPMEQWREVESWAIALTEFKATLSMVHTMRTFAYGEGYGYCTNIWVLVDSEKSIWVKQYTLEMPRKFFLNTVLDVWSDGKILLLNTFWKQKQDMLYRWYIIQFYNPSTETLTDIMEMAEEFSGTIAFYTGSLLS